MQPPIKYQPVINLKLPRRSVWTCLCNFSRRRRSRRDSGPAEGPALRPAAVCTGMGCCRVNVPRVNERSISTAGEAGRRRLERATHALSAWFSSAASIIRRFSGTEITSPIRKANVRLGARLALSGRSALDGSLDLDLGALKSISLQRKASISPGSHAAREP